MGRPIYSGRSAVARSVEMGRRRKNVVARTTAGDGGDGDDGWDFDFNKKNQNQSDEDEEQEPLKGLFQEGWRLKHIDSDLRLFGSHEIRIGYGLSTYLRRLDPLEREKGGIRYQYFYENFFTENRFFFKDPFVRSDLIGDGVFLDQKLVLSLKGTVGKKVEVEVDHHSLSEENTYRLEYTGDKTDWVDRIVLGKVDMNLEYPSRLMHARWIDERTAGLRLEKKSKRFYYGGSFSFSDRIPESKTFSFETTKEVIVREVDYVPKTYYQLPEGMIRGAMYFEEITDTNRHQEAALVVREVVSGDARRMVKYFDLVDAKDYELNRQTGLFRLQKEPPKGYSFVYYTRGDSSSGGGEMSRGMLLFFGARGMNYPSRDRWMYRELGRERRSPFYQF